MDRQAEKVVEMTPRLLAAILQSAKELTEILMKILEENKEYKSSRRMAEYLKDKDHNVDYQICKGFSYEALGKKLNEYNVPHVFLQDKKSGYVICVTREDDRELVRAARNDLFREQRCQSKVSYEDFTRINAGTRVTAYDNFTDVQNKKFAEYARRYGFVTSSVKQENGSYTVYFSTKDKEKADMAFRHTVLETTGIVGKGVKEQYTKELNNIKKSYDMFSKPSNNFYVVSTTNPKDVIHFDSEGFEHTKGNRVVNIGRNDDHFAQDSFNHVMELVEPMIVQKADFDKVTQFIENYSKQNNLSQTQMAATVWTFINKQYDGDASKFFDDVESDKAHLTIKENKKGESYLRMNKDNAKRYFTREEFAKISLENKIKESILEGKDAKEIISDFNITDQSEQQYVTDYVNQYYDGINEHRESSAYIDESQLRNGGHDDVIPEDPNR